jgi:hypothetical protein
MSKLWFAGVSVLLSGAAAAAAPDEWIGHGPLPGLVVGYQAAQPEAMIVERIPPGETVQRWTRMVTTQRFAGVIARGGTLAQWSGHFLEGLGSGCPGYRSTRPAALSIDGREAIAFRVDCPRNPQTGLPETLLLRAIAGRADLHVAQVAFRHLPSASETRWAENHLATVTLCTPQSASPVCRAGPEAFDR